MTANTIIDRDFNILIRVGSWAVVAFSILFLGISPADASVLYQRDVNRVEHLTIKFSNGLTWSDEFSGDAAVDFVSHDHSQVSDATSSKSQEDSNIISESQLVEQPNLGESAPTSSGSNGATNTCSSTGRGAPSPIAMARSELALPIPLLLSWPSIEQSLNVPPAPPFELLRPPSIFTISM